MRGRPFKLTAAQRARVLAPDHPPDVELAREFGVHPSTLWYARQRAAGRNFYMEAKLRRR